MSAMEYFASSPRKAASRPPEKIDEHGFGVRRRAARFVAMNEVPQPPLLEKTATIRLSFLGFDRFSGEFRNAIQDGAQLIGNDR